MEFSMAAGLPDYQQNVRPRFGAARFKVEEFFLLAGPMTVSFAPIEGKGMIYGGVVWIKSSGSEANGKVKLKIDGRTLETLSFMNLRDFAVTLPGSYSFSLMNYDNVDHVYSLAISYGITFEESLQILYAENDGENFDTGINIIYALIG